MRDISYPPIIAFGRVLFRLLGLRFQRSGTEHIPREGGALLAINHIGYVDFVLAGYAAVPAGRVIRFMAKREIFAHKIGGPVMRSMHHISVDRSDGVGSYREALRYLAEGELVGIFPEATISRSFEVKEIKSGAVRIAAEAGVPLIPVILWGTQRLMTKEHDRDLVGRKTIAIHVGEPLHPTGADPGAETRQLHEAMTALLNDTIDAYPPRSSRRGAGGSPRRAVARPRPRRRPSSSTPRSDVDGPSARNDEALYRQIVLTTCR